MYITHSKIGWLTHNRHLPKERTMGEIIKRYWQIFFSYNLFINSERYKCIINKLRRWKKIISHLPYCCEQWTNSSRCLFLGKMVSRATEPLIVPTKRCSGSSWLFTCGHAIEVTHAGCVSMWQSSPVTATSGPPVRLSEIMILKLTFFTL